MNQTSMLRNLKKRVKNQIRRNSEGGRERKTRIVSFGLFPLGQLKQNQMENLAFSWIENHQDSAYCFFFFLLPFFLPFLVFFHHRLLLFFLLLIFFCLCFVSLLLVSFLPPFSCPSSYSSFFFPPPFFFFVVFYPFLGSGPEGGDVL